MVHVLLNNIIGISEAASPATERMPHKGIARCGLALSASCDNMPLRPQAVSPSLAFTGSYIQESPLERLVEEFSTNLAPVFVPQRVDIKGVTQKMDGNVFVIRRS